MLTIHLRTESTIRTKKYRKSTENPRMKWTVSGGNGKELGVDDVGELVVGGM